LILAVYSNSIKDPLSKGIKIAIYLPYIKFDKNKIK
jgi:hypothetical protein